MFHVEQWDAVVFRRAFAVPDAAMQRLQRYADLLAVWQQKMNLVGPSTLVDLWGRHFADSAQLLRHAPGNGSWLDIGAGGGFPGLVLAILGVERVVLVESIAKKARFLEEMRDELGLGDKVVVQRARIEALPPLRAAVITARAVAPLVRLLDWSLRHARPGGLFLFPKGRRFEAEVAQARQHFAFELAVLPSMTDEEARILRLQQVKRRKCG